jgi:ribosome-binding factor A
MPREFSRRLRVAAELTRILNELLHVEVKDPRLKDVRVSEVEVSGDLGVARVFYSTLDPDADLAPIESALARAAAFMRARVGKEARLRRVPELRFELDASAREGFRISRLIDETARNASKTEPEPE